MKTFGIEGIEEVRKIEAGDYRVVAGSREFTVQDGGGRTIDWVTGKSVGCWYWRPSGTAVRHSSATFRAAMRDIARMVSEESR